MAPEVVPAPPCVFPVRLEHPDLQDTPLAAGPSPGRSSSRPGAFPVGTPWSWAMAPPHRPGTVSPPAPWWPQARDPGPGCDSRSPGGLLVQSMGHMSLVSIGAKVTLDGSWGVAATGPCSKRFSVSRQQVRPQHRQPIQKALGIFIGVNGGLSGGDHVPGIHLRCHKHRCDPRLFQSPGAPPTAQGRSPAGRAAGWRGC